MMIAFQNPVAANQAPVGLVTNTMGAMHGVGKLTTSSISESPASDAGNVFVDRLTPTTSAPAASVAGVRQLTIALNAVIGLVPALAPSASTSPRTRTLMRPSVRSSPFASARVQGIPPPGTPRKIGR